jgi:alkylhydroperoxidase family enzyme
MKGSRSTEEQIIEILKEQEAGAKTEDVQAIRDHRLPQDEKNAALSALARGLIEKRGHLEDRDIAPFIAVGFSQELALEVIAVVAASNITNYTGSVTQTPLASPFQAHVWHPQAA